MLFMPHSPGIYVALVLKDVAAIEDELDTDKETTMSNISAINLNKQDTMSMLKEQEADKSQGPPV